MALHQGGKYFTKWTHVENGQVLSRRLHRLEIQARDGRLYVLCGKQLPDYIQTCSGHGYKGEHVAQILLNPSPVGSEPPEPRTWPMARDVVHVALGLVGFFLARFLVALAEAAY